MEECGIEITFKDSLGNPNNDILHRDIEPNLEIVTASAPKAFNASLEKVKLVWEAYLRWSRKTRQ